MSHPVQCHQKDRDDCVLYLIAPLPLPLSPHMFLHTVFEGGEFFRTHPPSCILISCENAIAIRFGLRATMASGDRQASKGIGVYWLREYS